MQTGGGSERVTVVIPVHNSGAWLDETISSVRGQTYENFALNIVNDASTDDSPSIAHRHAAEDDRLTVLNVDYRSVARARQEGVDHAKTKLIAFLDGDDRWGAEFLDKMVNALSELDESVLAVYALHNLINERSEPIDRPADSTKGSSLGAATGMFDFDHYLLTDTPARTAGAVVVRAAALQGHRFRQEAEPCEDYELWLRVLLHHSGGTFYGVPEKLMDYRVRDDQQTSNTLKVFATLDRLYATYVPNMRRPETRWEVYEYAGSCAQQRGLPDFAEHFWSMSRLLSAHPHARPFVLLPPDAMLDASPGGSHA